MNMRSFFSRLFHSPIPRSATITLIALVTLAWSRPAFCDAIHDAARDGDLAMVTALLKDNPDLVFSKDNNGATPLHSAVARGHKDVAEFLLANGANVNSRDILGCTPLYWAANQGHKDVAELLLAKGADLNAVTLPWYFNGEEMGRATPLQYAVAWRHEDVAELLRQHGGVDMGNASRLHLN